MANNKTHFDYGELKPHIKCTVCCLAWGWVVYIAIVTIAVVSLICLIKCLVHQVIKQNQITCISQQKNHPIKKQCKKTKTANSKNSSKNIYHTKQLTTSINTQYKINDSAFKHNFFLTSNHPTTSYLWLIVFLVTVVLILILSIPIFRESEKKRLITLYLDDKELEHKLITDILEKIKDKLEVIKNNEVTQPTKKNTEENTNNEEKDIKKELMKVIIKMIQKLKIKDKDPADD